MPVANLANDYRVGTQKVAKIYAGDKLVWPMTPQWPTGLIVHHAGDTAPPGWAICDGVTLHGSPALKAIIGTDTTPNLKDMFVRTTAQGANTVALGPTHLPQHKHTMDNDSPGGHTHQGTSGSTNPTHNHTVTLGNNSVDHTHAIPATSTAADGGAHVHSSLIFNEGDGGSGEGTWVDQSPNNQGVARDVGNTGNPSANHQHSHVASNVIAVEAADYHQHDAYSSYFNAVHGHDFGVSNSGTHQHTIPGEGGGSQFNVVPEHYALIYIIRL